MPFEIARAGAIVSTGAADADRMQLARGMIGVAVMRGARIYQAAAVEYCSAARTVGVCLKSGCEIEAVVLATGYVMPEMIQSTVHHLVPDRSRKTSGRRRADLGRQQGLSVRKSHARRADHHRRRDSKEIIRPHRGRRLRLVSSICGKLIARHLGSFA